MSTNTQKHFQWVVESATALIIVGVGLNFLVMQTLGSFDAALVILGLFLGFWAFALGNTVVFLSSIWLFMRRRDMSAKSASEQAEAHVPRQIGLGALRRTEPCRAC
jgi:putative solute:sodium symporter small subunit